MAENVTRAELRGFDRLAQDLILQAVAAGARVRISSRGHAVVYLGDGSTCIAPNLGVANRAAQNAKAGVKRLINQSV